MFLDCVVGEVDHLVFELLGSKLLGSSADIPFFVPVAAHVAVQRSHQHVAPDVKFTLVVEEGHQVPLNYVRPRLPIGPCALVPDDLPNIIQGIDHIDATTLI